MKQPVIGLECHIQLNTDSKLFCSCTTKTAEEPNSNCCEICLGMPGSKPVLNKKAVDYALKVALALNCNINKKFFFSRKTYFYPDMSKNFQISQYEIPIAEKGFLQLPSGKKIGITRIHIEEDPAALVHESGMHSSAYSLVDYNRSGIPLIEVVTEPDMSSAEEAREFLDHLTKILAYLNVFDFEKGTLKADTNVSIKGSERVEIKNVTGKRSVEKAVQFEAQRQLKAIEKGEKIVLETRAFDEAKQITRPLRKKETEDDYGYIYESDLPGFELSSAEIEKLKAEMPELHLDKAQRLAKEFGITPYAAKVLSSSRVASDLFEDFAKSVSPVLSGTFVARDLVSIAHRENKELENIRDRIDEKKLTFALKLFEDKKITEKTLKDTAIASVVDGKDPEKYIAENNLLKDMGLSEIENIVKKILEQNPKAVEDLKAGNQKSLNFLLGLAMRATKGSAEPRKIKEIIEEKIK